MNNQWISKKTIKWGTRLGGQGLVGTPLFINRKDNVSNIHSNPTNHLMSNKQTNLKSQKSRDWDARSWNTRGWFNREDTHDRWVSFVEQSACVNSYYANEFDTDRL